MNVIHLTLNVRRTELESLFHLIFGKLKTPNITKLSFVIVFTRRAIVRIIDIWLRLKCMFCWCGVQMISVRGHLITLLNYYHRFKCSVT